MILVVKCRECGSIFPSTIQIDQLEYRKTAILEGRIEIYPKCGKSSVFVNHHLVVKSSFKDEVLQALNKLKQQIETQ
jgi:hypothetical protein